MASGSDALIGLRGDVGIDKSLRFERTRSAANEGKADGLDEIVDLEAMADHATHQFADSRARQAFKLDNLGHRQREGALAIKEGHKGCHAAGSFAGALSLAAGVLDVLGFSYVSPPA